MRAPGDVRGRLRRRPRRASRGRWSPQVAPGRRRRRGGRQHPRSASRADRRQGRRGARHERPGCRRRSASPGCDFDDLSPFHLIRGSKAPPAPRRPGRDRQGHGRRRRSSRSATRSRSSRRAGRREYELVGIVEFGDADSLLGATTRRFTPATAQRVLGDAGQGRRDRREGRLRGLRRTRSSTDIRDALSGDRGHRGPHRREAITKETQDDIKESLSLLQHVPARLRRRSRCSSARFIIFNTFSIIVAQRSREMALLRAIGAKGGQVIRSVLVRGAARRGRRVGPRASSAAILLSPRAEGAARRVRRRHPRRRDHHPAERDDHRRSSSASSSRSSPRSSRRARPRASRRSPRCATSRSTSRSSTWKRIVIGIAVTLLGRRVAARSASSARQRDQPRRLGAFVVFLGVAILGPVIARPISRVLGWPLIRRSRASPGCSRGRTRSGTRSARRRPPPR